MQLNAGWSHTPSNISLTDVNISASVGSGSSEWLQVAYIALTHGLGFFDVSKQQESEWQWHGHISSLTSVLSLVSGNNIYRTFGVIGYIAYVSARPINGLSLT